MSDGHSPPTANEILDAATAVVEQVVPDDALRSDLIGLVRSFERCTGDPPFVPPLTRIPALVYEGVTGSFEPALPLCGVALLLYLGLDVLDDLMDGDVTPYAAEHTSNEALLLGTALVSAVPHAAIAGCNADASTTSAMHLALAVSLLRMAGGQKFDLAARGVASVDPGLVEGAVNAKSGEFTALLAALAATFAGAAVGTIAAYEGWGRAYGTADQLRSDCFDLFRDPIGSDLQNGTLTFPLACFIESDNPSEREHAETLIRSATKSRMDLIHLREALVDSRVLNVVDFAIRYYVQVGESALAATSPAEPAASLMSEMIGRCVLPEAPSGATT